MPFFEKLLQLQLTRRREEGQGRNSPDEGVEVNARPSSERFFEGEDQERTDSKRKGKLCAEIGRDVVVTFLGGWISGQWVKEKRSNVSAEV